MAAPEEEECPACPAGLPAWLATFADLMSLLMCFFVLLLSFSEMDVQKYKRVAGSMQFAFGVQREIDAKQIPKGTSVVAKEFSPGKPVPTPMPSVRQMTTSEMKQNLDFSDSTEKNNNSDGKSKGHGRSRDQLNAAAAAAIAVVEAVEAGEDTKPALQQMTMALAQLEQELEGQEAEAAMAKLLGSTGEDKGNPEGELGDELNRVLALEKAGELRKALRSDIYHGLVEIEALEDSVVLRVRERGFFKSGKADLQAGFADVVTRIAESVNAVGGAIIVAGHTDNVPIYNRDFKSNWELSSARAATVVRNMIDKGGFPADKVEIRAHADTRALADNNTSDGRTKNRRIEIIVLNDDSLNDESGATTGDQ